MLSPYVIYEWVAYYVYLGEQMTYYHKIALCGVFWSITISEQY